MPFKSSFKSDCQIYIHKVHHASNAWMPVTSNSYLTVEIFNVRQSTRQRPCVFPMLFQEHFIFEKYFVGVTSKELEKALKESNIRIELRMIFLDGREGPMLASFTTSTLNFFFPDEKFGSSVKHDQELVMTPTSDYMTQAPIVQLTSTVQFADSMQKIRESLEYELASLPEPCSCCCCSHCCHHFNYFAEQTKPQSPKKKEASVQSSSPTTSNKNCTVCGESRGSHVHYKATWIRPQEANKPYVIHPRCESCYMLYAKPHPRPKSPYRIEKTNAIVKVRRSSSSNNYGGCKCECECRGGSPPSKKHNKSRKRSPSTSSSSSSSSSKSSSDEDVDEPPRTNRSRGYRFCPLDSCRDSRPYPMNQSLRDRIPNVKRYPSIRRQY